MIHHRASFLYNNTYKIRTWQWKPIPSERISSKSITNDGKLSVQNGILNYNVISRQETSLFYNSRFSRKNISNYVSRAKTASALGAYSRHESVQGKWLFYAYSSKRAPWCFTVVCQASICSCHILTKLPSRACHFPKKKKNMETIIESSFLPPSTADSN